MSILSQIPCQRLDQRVTFERRVETQDNDTGAPVTTWQSVVTCHAAIDAIKANDKYIERRLGDQITDSGDYTVWIRWRGDLDESMRINWRGRFLNILKLPDQQRRGRFLAIFATSGQSSG